MLNCSYLEIQKARAYIHFFGTVYFHVISKCLALVDNLQVHKQICLGQAQIGKLRSELVLLWEIPSQQKRDKNRNLVKLKTATWIQQWQ